MNYGKIYSSLIERAKFRHTVGYVETHHIIPVCMGGTDDRENLVDLYPEEHFVVHLLLVKIYPDNVKLVFAANMMGNRNNKNMDGCEENLLSLNLKHTKDLNKALLLEN